jgi:hypothetical protein
MTWLVGGLFLTDFTGRTTQKDNYFTGFGIIRNQVKPGWFDMKLQSATIASTYLCASIEYVFPGIKPFSPKGKPPKTSSPPGKVMS